LEELTLLQTQFETEKKDKSIAEQQVKLNKQTLELIKNQKEKEMYLIVSFGLILISLGIWYSFRQRQKIKNKEIITLQQQQEIAQLEALIEGEEKERKRIAQELHDGLNGDLSAIKYRLTTFEESGLSAIDTENLNKVINMIDDSCAQVRNISHNLMPSSILEYGLIETIREYCLKINTHEHFHIDFQFFGNYLSLSKKTETVIYRIIQELVTNILKHSKATEALIQFNYREDELFITVEDNGIGFDKNVISKGIGHQNIQTRIDFLNAQINVDSSSTGTSYTISIDLNKVK
jgi:two-component system, NarL family, sensor kinase